MRARSPPQRGRDHEHPLAARFGITENDVEGMPDFPSDAVDGFYKKIVGGKLVGIRTLERSVSAPENLADYVFDGGPDADGYIYYDMTGGGTRDGATFFEYHYIGRQPLRLSSQTADKPQGR